MKESDAKQKWCPFARAYDASDQGDAVAATNRPLRYGDSLMGGATHARDAINCIGSQCMAWRWSKGSAPSRREGYCGLAGKPEGA